jgi:multisubunit Na+/H+ antiporter MnhG subunit
MNNNSKNQNMSELRNFGLLVGSVFLLIAIWPLFFNGEVRVWAGILSALLIVPGAVMPQLLKIPFVVWNKIAHALGWLNTRIILAILFYFILTPLSFVLKLIGKDPLNKNFEISLESYREIRENKEQTNYLDQF